MAEMDKGTRVEEFEGRPRDLLSDLRVLPKLCKPEGRGGRTVSRHRRDAARNNLVNEVVPALTMLWAGAVTEDILGDHAGPIGPPLERRPAQEQALLGRLLRRAAVFLEEVEEKTMHVDAALERLLGPVAGLVAKGRGKGQRGIGLRRGDLCDLVVDNVALPDGSKMPVPLIGLSPTAAQYLADVGALLRDPGKVREEPAAGSHSDRSLKDKKVMLHMAGRLFKAHMLRGVQTARSHTGIFAVVKKVKDDGSYEQRLIFDMCRGNQFWVRPPWTPLGGPSALAWLDFSRCAGSFEVAAGDVPDYYHRLEVPEECSEWFCLEGLSPKELREHLAKEGVDCDLSGAGVGLRTVPMGWSWAVFLAQAALRDLTFDARGGPLREERALVEGAPVPSLPGPSGIVHSEYIDDFTVIGIVAVGSEGQVKEVYEGGAKEIKAAGLDLHKENFGNSSLVLGHMLGPGPTARPPAGKVWILIAATRELLSMKAVRASWVESIVGIYSWYFLLCRGCFSIFARVYGWTQENRDNKSLIELPILAKAELETAARVVPFIVVDLAAPWHEIAQMTDASEEGGAVVETKASHSELAEEGRWAPRGGWTLYTGRPEELERRDISREPPAEEGDSDLRIPEGVVLKRVVFLHLFSGHRRENDLEHFLMRIGASLGLMVVVVCADLGYGDQWDLRKRGNTERLLKQISEGYYHAVHSGPPCSTWSAARFSEKPGPPPLRSRLKPWGISGLPQKHHKQVQEANIMMMASLDILDAFFSRSLPGAKEHPEHIREELPSIWATEEWKQLEAKHSLIKAAFDQCEFGAVSRKPSCLGTNIPEFSAASGRRCSHGGHPALVGKDSGGTSRPRVLRVTPPRCAR